MDQTDLDHLENRIYEHIDDKYIRREDHEEQLEELRESLRKELEYELKVLRKELEDLRWLTRDLS